MLELLKWIFESGWRFVGVCALMLVAGMALELVVAALPRRVR